MKRALFLLLLFFLSLPPSARGGDLDTYFLSKGLVDVRLLDPTLVISLQYAQTSNIFGQAVYPELDGIWLHPHAAAKLVKAQRLLKDVHPEYSLIVYDAARPMSVQRQMWNLVRGTNKTNYVSNPANGGGLHNYGMAVDVSIVDRSGKPLPMGSPFDYFGEEAHINQEETLLRKGKITSEEYNNRLLLRQVMRNAGFRTILYEWWHFNACTRTEARQHYRLIE